MCPSVVPASCCFRCGTLLANLSVFLCAYLHRRRSRLQCLSPRAPGAATASHGSGDRTLEGLNLSTEVLVDSVPTLPMQTRAPALPHLLAVAIVWLEALCSLWLYSSPNRWVYDRPIPPSRPRWCGGFGCSPPVCVLGLRPTHTSIALVTPVERW